MVRVTFSPVCNETPASDAGPDKVCCFCMGKGGRRTSGGQLSVHYRDLPACRGGGFRAVGHHY